MGEIRDALYDQMDDEARAQREESERPARIAKRMRLLNVHGLLRDAEAELRGIGQVSWREEAAHILRRLVEVRALVDAYTPPEEPT